MAEMPETFRRKHHRGYIKEIPEENTQNDESSREADRSSADRRTRETELNESS